MQIKATFIEALVRVNVESENILLSDADSARFENKVFIIVTNTESNKEIYSLQINCEYYCTMFRDVKVWNDFVVIGFDNYCYLFNFKTKEFTHHKLLSYFDNFYATNDKIFICSASNINCFDNTGRFLWRSKKLGVKSVNILKVEDGIVKGSGDWDAPRQWVDFEFHINEYPNSSKKPPKKLSILKSFIQGIKNK